MENWEDGPRAGRGLVLHYPGVMLPPLGKSSFYLWSFHFHRELFQKFLHQFLRFPKPHLKDTTFLSAVERAYVKELETQGTILHSSSGRARRVQHASTQGWETVFNTILSHLKNCVKIEDNLRCCIIAITLSNYLLTENSSKSNVGKPAH